MTKRWIHRPADSTWGDWGGDDELGRINLLTPEKVRQGVREVEAGITFSLSLPLDYPGGSALNQRRYPPILRPKSPVTDRWPTSQPAVLVPLIGSRARWSSVRSASQRFPCPKMNLPCGAKALSWFTDPRMS